MKKFFVSVGLATAGAAAFQASSMAQSSMLESPKVWNVSAQLDGFYDDNYATTSNKKGSYGIEFSPTVSADIPLTQTEFGVLYTYGVQWYQERSDAGQNAFDQDHSFNLWVDHSFNERWNVKVSDTVVDGQEPELLNTASGSGGSPYRLNGDNVVNNGTVDLHTDWTRLFSSDLTYGNVFTDYSQSGTAAAGTIPATTSGGVPIPGGNPITDGLYNVSSGGVLGTPSYAGELNRIQNSVNLDLQWHLAPQTIIDAGYQFQIVNYTGDELIGYANTQTGTGVPGNFPLYNGYTGTAASIHAPIQYYSNSRDNLSHIGYVGLTENLLDSLVFAGRAGFQYVDDFNDPLNKSTSVDPYVTLSLIYTYLPDCTAQLGFTQSRNATDVVTVNNQNGSITLDQESSTLYASINHHITQKLLVSVIGQYANSVFDGGEYANQSDTDYNLGVSANYAFTRNFSANINYNFDDLVSPIDMRGYDRNRISIGVSVAY
jgi:hypothetical protein